MAHTGADDALHLLESGEKVVALLDPTFPAVLDKGTPGQLVTALKKLGFTEVWESAVGGDLVTQEYKKWLSKNKNTSSISSFCPSLVLYIEKFAPQLIDRLVPLVSPMIAAGMAVKKLKGAETKVVFIGSCISRIWERQSHHVKGIVDYVLIYHDISKVLEEKGIEREKQEPSEFDGPPAGLGRILSISGGMSKCIRNNQNLLNLDHLIVAGPDRAVRALQQLQNRTIRSKFLDLLFCQGCIDGPIVDKNISGPSRKQIVIDFIKTQQQKTRKADNTKSEETKSLDLKRSFTPHNISLPEPKEEDIQAVLKKMGKTYPNQNLDCGGCGYNSCREKASAVVQGLAEMEMCMHYLLSRSRRLYAKLEKSHEQLQHSHDELEKAQRQLIQTEKMASLGQLAAGVAHELNNPLGTITLYSQFLKKELKGQEKLEKDIDLVIQETDRAAKIVKDLLSFSREAKLKPGLLNLNSIIEEALSLLEKRVLFQKIEVKRELDPSLPSTFADPDLLKQVFLNIILNGAQAMEGEGVLTLKSQVLNGGKELQIQIMDTGKGIAKEYLSRLFDPFFTTKKKGTGLGLAIVYGIISKHKGTVHVDSQLDKRTTFSITLPVLDQKEWMESEQRIHNMKSAEGGQKSGAKSKDLIG
ncbi:MAG: ATP-binding protein [Candidatus Aminicenantes bacterium]|nr:ATP-binding protein [Candidatus Aminicenantes bacterium]